jgi:flavin reductase (DIM6/NTAB) family NADH-FMN oxidoreductase RutF
VIAADDFRHVLGHFATGVTILTTCDNDARPTGLTASAFSSVSLDPPLVLICVDHKSQSYPALKERGCFAVNILGAQQQAISRRCASSRLDKFDEVPHTISDRGLPLIEGALAHLECTTVSVHVEGDHTIFVGRVERAQVGSGEPLLYFRGQYQQLASPPSGA